MHRQWPFFRTLLSNLDMVLAKSDLRIAARYVELVEDRKLAQAASSAAIEAEWERTHEALTLITGEAERLLQPGAGALDRAPLPLPRPAEPPAGRADAPLPRGRIAAGRDPADGAQHRCSAASTCRSTALRRGCATPADLDVQQHDVGAVLLQRLHALAHVGAFADHVAARVQAVAHQRGEPAACQRLVVDDQHPQRRHGAHARSPIGTTMRTRQRPL
jgi:hypothetical protein